MRKLYDIRAYEGNGNIVDPTNGEYILARTKEEAIAEAMTIAEQEGKDLYNFFVEDVENFLTDEMFSYDEYENGFYIFDSDGEYFGFISANAENKNEIRSTLYYCYDLEEVVRVFDDIDREEEEIL